MQKTIRIGVFGSANGWYFKDLQRAALTRSTELCTTEIIPLDFSTLRVSSLNEVTAYADYQFRSDNAASTSVAQKKQYSLSDFDAILVRTMPLGSLEQIIFRMNALHIAEQTGVPVLNSPRCLEICIDKWLTIQKARSAGLLTPRTICCQTRDDAMDAWQTLGKDCVVKPIFGGEGRGIVRVTDSDMAWRVFSTLDQLNSVHYVQEYIETDGSDLRCLVLGESIYCMRRRAAGNWRTNVSQGGTGELHEPSFEQVDMAYRAAKAVGGWMVGIDLLEAQSGMTHLLEVNAVPGWKATSLAINVDIAGEMIGLLACSGAH